MLLDYLFMLDLIEWITMSNDISENKVSNLVKRINLLKRSAEIVGYDLQKLTVKISGQTD